MRSTMLLKFAVTALVLANGIRDDCVAGTSECETGPAITRGPTLLQTKKESSLLESKAVEGSDVSETGDQMEVEMGNKCKALEARGNTEAADNMCKAKCND